MTVGQLVEHRDDEPFAGPLRRSPLAKLRPLLRSPGGFVGASIFILLILLAVFAPLFAPQDPLKQSLRDANTPPFWMTDGSTKFLVGTDALGRDILSRLIYGSRVSLTVAVGGVLIAATLGMLLGLIAGYRGGRIDRIIVGGTVLDNVSTKEQSGVIRAYDIPSGRLAWNWDSGNPDDTEPLQPGEFYTPNSPNSWSINRWTSAQPSLTAHSQPLARAPLSMLEALLRPPLVNSQRCGTTSLTSERCARPSTM